MTIPLSSKKNTFDISTIYEWTVLEARMSSWSFSNLLFYSAASKSKYIDLHQMTQFEKIALADPAVFGCSSHLGSPSSEPIDTGTLSLANYFFFFVRN